MGLWIAQAQWIKHIRDTANGAVYGILTPLEDMPLSGTLQSQTGATAAIQDDTSQYALYDGTVNVTFSNSKVSATLSDFRGMGQTSGGALTPNKILSNEKTGSFRLDLSIHLTNAALLFVLLGRAGRSLKRQFCGGSVCSVQKIQVSVSLMSGSNRQNTIKQCHC